MNRVADLWRLTGRCAPELDATSAAHHQRMKLVILDRDGTLNDDRDDHVKSPRNGCRCPGALEAVARLNQAGWHVVVATNQSGIGRGLSTWPSLNAMHPRCNAVAGQLGGRIDAVFFCPHAPEDGCDCRKPLPGLIEQIGERYGVDLKGCADGRRHAARPAGRAAAGCEPTWC
jgi:D-glycero-D-manno-heptose 1,7-bisphosphate phosphatase